MALLPLLAIVAFLLAMLATFAARCVLLGRPRTPQIEAREHTVLAKFFQEWWVWLFGPIERAAVRLGISPDAVTLTSAAVAAVAAALAASGHLSAAGWTYLFGSSLDLVDGRVARATGRASRAGAFLDSSLDRLSELLVLGGLAFALRGSPWVLAPIAASGASVLVSYARARGEALGIVAEAKVGGMQRPERVVLAGIPCALSPLWEAAGWPGGATGLVGAALAVVAASSAITAARRIASIYLKLRAADPPPRRERRPFAAVFRLEARRRRAFR